MGNLKRLFLNHLPSKEPFFEGGEKMTVWVTDDRNRMPVRIESPIIVGKVRIDMTSFQGLKNPMSALIKKF